jgi:hypothetical protein
MIDRYTNKFGPAVSQKELEKALTDGTDAPIKNMHTLKARIDRICDYKDLQAIADLIKRIKGESEVA